MKEVFVAPVHPPLALHDEGVPLDIILFVGAHGNGGGGGTSMRGRVMQERRMFWSKE